MKHDVRMICGVFAGLLITAGAHAVDTEAVVGGAVGGAVGAAVGSELGGREGAIVGGAAGAALGAAIATDGDEPEHREREVHIHYGEADDRRGPPAHAYRAPPGHVKHRGKH